MTWPLWWLIPMEAARSVWEAMTAVNRAMTTLDGDKLDDWRRDNANLVSLALDVEELRAALDEPAAALPEEAD